MVGSSIFEEFINRHPMHSSGKKVNQTTEKRMRRYRIS